MTEQDRLIMLKIDLGISSDGYNTRLTQYLQAAEKAIIKEGVATLDSSTLEDSQLIVMYAAWSWRKRDSGAGMPRMLRLALNNRIFEEKMASN